jgi:hypothetical protein
LTGPPPHSATSAAEPVVCKTAKASATTVNELPSVEVACPTKEEAELTLTQRQWKRGAHDHVS